jgi:lysophospholipase L1-like esterase
MRDDGEHRLEHDGRVRIAVVGDSIVWGEDLELADTLPRALGRELGSGAEVLAFGVTGYDSAQEAEWYERAVRRFTPDIVVVVYCLNDIRVASGPFHVYATPEESRREADDDALLARVAPVRAETLDTIAERDEATSVFHLIARARWMVRRTLFQRRSDYADDTTVLYAQPDRVARVDAALGRLGAAIRATPAVAHLVISPMLRDFDRYHWTAAHAVVRRAGERAGFVVHDSLDAWRNVRPSDLRMPGDSVHYSATGTSRFAHFIAESVRPLSSASVGLH